MTAAAGHSRNSAAGGGSGNSSNSSNGSGAGGVNYGSGGGSSGGKAKNYKIKIDVVTYVDTDRLKS